MFTRYGTGDIEETLSDAKTNCLPADAVLHNDVGDIRELLCNDKSYLRTS